MPDMKGDHRMKKRLIVWMLGITVGGATLAQQTSTLIRSSSSKAATATASAAEVDTTVYPYTPFMFSIVTPLQVPSSNFDVGGLRINAIYGECQNFDGFDISTVGRARGHGNGLQVALLANIVDGDGLGLQIAPVNYVSGSYDGWQIGAVNYGAANPQSTAQALQIGFFNGSDFIKGCQIGVINIAREMIGFQIGVVNVIQNKEVPFLPIINCYF
jgi:hypothetical protein